MASRKKTGRRRAGGGVCAGLFALGVAAQANAAKALAPPALAGKAGAFGRLSVDLEAMQAEMRLAGAQTNVRAANLLVMQAGLSPLPEHDQLLLSRALLAQGGDLFDPMAVFRLQESAPASVTPPESPSAVRGAPAALASWDPVRREETLLSRVLKRLGPIKVEVERMIAQASPTVPAVEIGANRDAAALSERELRGAFSGPAEAERFLIGVYSGGWPREPDPSKNDYPNLIARVLRAFEILGPTLQADSPLLDVMDALEGKMAELHGSVEDSLRAEHEHAFGELHHLRQIIAARRRPRG